ncbi:MAG: cyclic nucleotide-binding domain-containing protein [Ardenticatenaceae bacterium]|nr:cyclic nucleotide-binding domain-containing protein [Ardenticatenaceae bacterium]
MKQAFNRLFNIRPHELPRFSWLYLMSLILVIGRLWGRFTLNAVFLDEVGADKLPIFFTVNAILSIPAVAIYTAFADRARNDRLLIGIHLAAAAALALGLLLLQLGLTRIAYTLMYVVVFVPLGQILGAHWYTYINGFYDTRAAKRLLPLLVTSFGVAAIVSGLTVQWLNTVLTPAQIMFVWFGMMLLTILMILAQSRILPEKPVPGAATWQTAVSTTPNPTFFDNIREGYRYVMDSGLLRWLVVGTLLISVLVTLLEYLTGQVLASQLGTTQKIAGFLGQLAAFANLLIVLPMQLFILNRLIERIGLGAANFIFPVGNLLVGLSFILSPNLWMARLAQINMTDFRYSIGAPIENLLYNAVPLRVKGRARAFISGVITPIGTLLGGLILFLLARLLSTSALDLFVRGGIGVLAVAYVIVGWLIRRQYQRALVQMLAQEDYSFLLNQEASDLTVTDPAALLPLANKLAQSDNPDYTAFLVRLISEMGGNTAVPILEKAARDGDTAVRAIIIDILVATDMRGPLIRQLYTDMLQDADAHVRQSAWAGLVQLEGESGTALQTLAGHMLNDPDPAVRARVLPVLLRAEGTPHREQALAVLAQFLHSEDRAQQVQGIRVLAQVGDVYALNQLLQFVAAAADLVRLETAVALETAVTASRTKIPPHMVPQLTRSMLARLDDPVERVRQAALLIIAALGTPGDQAILPQAFRDSSQAVRVTAVNALVGLGKAAVPIVHPQLDAPLPQQRKLAAMTLSRVNVREYGPLINTHVTANLLNIFRHQGYLLALQPLTNFAGVAVLCSALREENDRLLQEIFYLLTAVHNPADVRIIHEALISRDERTRANAVEALEAITSPQTAGLIAPLFSPDFPQAELLQLSLEMWEMQPPTTREAMESLITDHALDPWLRTIATYALGEIGAAFIPKPKPQPEKPQRRTPADLLAALSDDNASPAAPATPPADSETPAASQTPASDDQPVDERQKRRERRRQRAASLLDALSADPTPSPPAAPGAPPAVSPTAAMDTIYTPPPTVNRLFNLPDVMRLLQAALQDSDDTVRLAAAHAQAAIAGGAPAPTAQKEGTLLSVLERIIFLKEVLFFRGMTVDQLKVLANVCEEHLFSADTAVYREGDAGGVLYVVVNGRVAIERAGQRKGSVTRLGTVEANAYFGEMDLFTNSPRTASAIALQDTLTLSLRREPLLALMRQQPDLSLELINVLSERLNDATDQIARLTRSTPRELHKLFDELEA